MKKGLIAAAIIVCIGITAGTVFLVLNRDKTAPEIKVPGDNTLTYVAGQDKKLLLEGITAVDDKDGDVSDTLMVESVKPTADGTQAEVTYTAMDNSHNVTKKKLMVNYQASGEAAPADSGQAPEGTEEGQESGEAVTEAPAPEGETTGEGTGEGEAAPADPSADPAAQEQPPQETAGGAEAAEAAIAQLPAGSPQFRLNEYEVTLPVGSKFDYSTYIQDITDDKDDRSTLFRQIQLQNPVDTNTPGTYEVVYYVVDSDGNQSNTAILKVNIQ